ncbi:MAG: hypothetical protein AAFR10_21685, partial [Pseudomonadota bacterium]
GWCRHYQDDLVVAAATSEGLLRALASALRRLRHRAMRAKPSKTLLGARRVPLLGHQVDLEAGERRPLPEAVRAVLTEALAAR